jgi:hypothetical protein
LKFKKPFGIAAVGLFFSLSKATGGPIEEVSHKVSRARRKTMEQIFPTIRSMTWEEVHRYGLFNQGLMLNHKTVSYRLSAGTSDSIHSFKSSAAVLYVLTINDHHQYASLDAYIGSEDEAIDSIFLQGSALQEFIGSDWNSLPLPSLATRLIQLFA